MPEQTPPTDQEHVRFQESISTGTRYEKTYTLFGGYLVAQMEAPLSREMDLAVEMLDEMERRGSLPSLLVRAAHTLRIRLYVRQLKVGDQQYDFLPVSEVADSHWSTLLPMPFLRRILLRRGARKLLRGLAFSGEGLYNVLRTLSGDFKAHLSALSSEYGGQRSALEGMIQRQKQPGGVLDSKKREAKNADQPDGTESPAGD